MAKNQYKVGEKHYIGVELKKKRKKLQDTEMWENTVKTWKTIKKIIRRVQSGLALGGWKPNP